MMASAETVAPCSKCHTQTKHKVLHSVATKHPTDDGNGDVELHELIQCAGCDTISMRHRWLGEADPDGPPKPEDEFYPSPIARKQPSGLFSWSLPFALWPDETNKTQVFLSELFDEIYRAVNGGQHRLATMGIRSLLETIMVANVGDHGSFVKNLEAFRDKGFISLWQYDAMKTVLDTGHAVTHRLFRPSKSHLNIALDIAEGIFAAIYVHSKQTEQLGDAIPQRSTRKR